MFAAGLALRRIERLSTAGEAAPATVEEVAHDVEEAFVRLDLPPGLSRVRDETLHWAGMAETLDSDRLLSHLESFGLAAEVERVLAATPWPLPPGAKPGAMPAEALFEWWHLFGLMNHERLDEEIAAARHDMATRCDEASQHKLIALCTARDARLELSATEAEVDPISTESTAVRA